MLKFDKLKRLTTLDMEVVMMDSINPRQNLVVTNPHWGLFLGNRAMHECDILYVTKSGYATEIEIKISKADLLKDKEKRHNHAHNHIARLYFAVPESLEELALQEIPERAGLYVVRQEEVRYRKNIYTDEEVHYFKTVLSCVREAKRNQRAEKWSITDKYQLARLGTIRVWSLKKKLQKIKPTK